MRITDHLGADWEWLEHRIGGRKSGKIGLLELLQIYVSSGYLTQLPHGLPESDLTAVFLFGFQPLNE